MKNEITNSEYVKFLNIVDPNGTNSYNLYSENMTNDDNGGINFDITAVTGSRYSTKDNMASKPVTNISWVNMARLCNWLSTGASYLGASGVDVGSNVYSGPTANFIIGQNSGIYQIGMLSNGSTSVISNTPSRPVFLNSSSGNGDILNYSAAKKLSVGTNHLMVLNSNGELYSWGSNTYGQLGNGSTTNITSLTSLNKISFSDSIEDMVSGDEASVAISSSGKLYKWGKDITNSINKIPSGEKTYYNYANQKDIDNTTTVPVISPSLLLNFNGNYNDNSFNNVMAQQYNSPYMTLGASALGNARFGNSAVFGVGSLPRQQTYLMYNNQTGFNLNNNNFTMEFYIQVTQTDITTGSSSNVLIQGLPASSQYYNNQ
jgi:hypothetical protein